MKPLRPLTEDERDTILRGLLYGMVSLLEASPSLKDEGITRQLAEMASEIADDILDQSEN